RPHAHEPSILAWRSSDDPHLHHDSIHGHKQRARGLVCRRAGPDGIFDFRNDPLPAAATSPVRRRMPDSNEQSSKRVLEPIERVSEVLFGLIMVLTFTGSLSVAESGGEDV